MSLRPLKTVDRRGDWRARLPFWDRETFQTIPVGAIGSANEAVVSLALFREGDDCSLYSRWRWDYGRLCPWQHHPVLNVFTDDQTGFLTVEDDGLAALLKVPQLVIAHLEPGNYRASLAAAYQNGDVIDLGSDLVSIVGHATPTVFHSIQMIGGQQPFANDQPFAAVFPPSVPILPGFVPQIP